ncbi:hypothetical protein DY000_02001597, partial [Brassica cretica]
NSCLYRLRDETDEEHLGKLKSQIKGKENSKLEERIMSVSSLEFTFRAASRHVNSVSRFCGQKYLLLVHPSMEASFFGNLDMRGLVLLGKASKNLVLSNLCENGQVSIGSLAGSLDPKAKIFGALSSSTMPGFKLGDSVIKSQVYLSKTEW